MSLDNPSRLNAHVSRRRIVQGAAWAAPAILIATAAPAFAATSGTITISGMTITQNGNSSNFEPRLQAAVTGFAAGDVITLSGAFNAGGQTVSVTDNSSGWVVATQNTAGDGTFTFTATKAYDGSGAIAVTKFKINVSDAPAIIGTPATISLSRAGVSSSIGGTFQPAR